MRNRLAHTCACLCLLLWSFLPALSQTESSDQPPSNRHSQEIVVDPVGKAALGLQYFQVKRVDKPVEIKTTGKIEAIPTREFTQHSMLSGSVTSVNVMPGDHVTAGQALVIIDSPELNQLAAETVQTKEQIENDIKQAKITGDAEVSQANAQLQLAQANYNRDKLLLDKGIAAEKEVQTSLADLEVAKNRLQAATQKKNATLENLQNRLHINIETLTKKLIQMGVGEAQVRAILQSNHTITSISIESVRSGIISEILASAGQSVSPNVPLVKISDLSRVWATADIYEQDVASVHLNQAVAVKVAAFPNLQFEGRLTFIGKQINPQTRTLPVRIEIPNPDLKLTLDMFADLTIKTDVVTSAILVPKDAIVERNGKTAVFKKIAESYSPVAVTTGRTFSDQVEIISGVSPGDIIVSRGAYQLNSEGNQGGRWADNDDDQGTNKPAPSTSVSPAFLAIALFLVFILGFGLAALLMRKPKGVSNHPKEEPAEPSAVVEK